MTRAPCDEVRGILKYAHVGFLAALTLLSAGQLGAPVVPAAVEARIAERLLRLRGVMGVAARDLRSGATIAVRADERFPTASVIKLGVMVAAFHEIDAGRLRGEQLVPVDKADRVGDGGVVDRLHDGVVLSVRDLLDLMIRLSDNSATNVLVRLVGTKAVNARLAQYGLANTLLFRPTFRDGHPDVHPELEREFGLGMATPRDLASLMEKIARGEVVSRAASEAMIEILEGQQDRLMIARGLPMTAGDVRVASKTGWDAEKTEDAAGHRGDVRGDVAIVTGPGFSYVLAILARRIADTNPNAENEGLVAGADVARIVHEHFAATGSR
jgi:beta-lactamase class A